MKQDPKADTPAPAEQDDLVWRMLAQSKPHKASAGFVDDVVRQALELEGNAGPWWARYFAPKPIAAVAGIAAAVVIGFFILPETPSGPGIAPPVVEQAPTSIPVQEYAHLQEVLETELLLVATEHPEHFSDAELIALIGF